MSLEPSFVSKVNAEKLTVSLVIDNVDAVNLTNLIRLLSVSNRTDTA